MGVQPAKPGEWKGPMSTTKPRIVWTRTKRGFVAATQTGSVKVELINMRFNWQVRVNGEVRRIGTSEGSAKRYGREFF